MRRPRSKKLFTEYQQIKKYSESEISVDNINLEGDLRVALIFPNTYDVAMSSLSFTYVWKLLNELPEVRCERFVVENEFSKFYSLDSFTPLDEFKVWAFPIHFELDLINVFDFLKKRSVAISWEKRSDNDPIILFGGALSYHTPEILFLIADVLIHGDLEAHLLSLKDVLVPQTKYKLLAHFSKLKGVSVPPLNKFETEPLVAADINTFPPVSPVISSRAQFSNKVLIEIERGCIWNCSFCELGASRKPARFLDLGILKNLLKIHKNVGLIASNVTDYPFLNEVLDVIEENNVHFSVSSLRINKLRKRFLSVLHSQGQQTFTIAPEAATQRIRDVLKKGIKDDDIDSALLLGKEAGFSNVKMYFIYGIQEENEQDLMAFGKLVEKALRVGYKSVIASFNPLIPKKGTAFSTRDIQSLQDLRRKMTLIRKLIPRKTKVKFEPPRKAYLQYILNQANSSTALEVLRLFERNENYRFSDVLNILKH